MCCPRARLFRPPTGSNPWRILLHSDEVTPGNQLSAQNDRNIQAIYWSSWEFDHKLADERFWFTFTANRSSQIGDVSGGMSQIFGYFLKMLFVRNCLDVAGCAFTLTSGRRFRLFAKLGFFIQDGGAHKLTWHCRGDAGVKFCLLCRNAYSRRSLLFDADSDGDGCCDIMKVNDM